MAHETGEDRWLINRAQPEALWTRAAELQSVGAPAVLVTVVACSGSTPRQPGSRAIMHLDGSIEGTIGGGRVEAALQALLGEVISSATPRLIEHKLTTELGMCCGGSMTFFMEPLPLPPTLIIFGCGHIGRALAYAAQPLDLRLLAVDERQGFLAAGRLPAGCVTLDSMADEDLAELPWGPQTYVVICTHDHELDQRLLHFAVQRQPGYLGVIGSRRKAAKQRQRLAVHGVAEERIARVRCPIGIDLGSQTPAEIAVAICAELIACRRAKDSA